MAMTSNSADNQTAIYPHVARDNIQGSGWTTEKSSIMDRPAVVRILGFGGALTAANNPKVVKVPVVARVLHRSNDGTPDKVWCDCERDDRLGVFLSISDFALASHCHHMSYDNPTQRQRSKAHRSHPSRTVINTVDDPQDEPLHADGPAYTIAQCLDYLETLCTGYSSVLELLPSALIQRATNCRPQSSTCGHGGTQSGKRQ